MSINESVREKPLTGSLLDTYRKGGSIGRASHAPLRSGCQGTETDAWPAGLSTKVFDPDMLTGTQGLPGQGGGPFAQDGNHCRAFVWTNQGCYGNVSPKHKGEDHTGLLLGISTNILFILKHSQVYLPKLASEML